MTLCLMPESPLEKKGEWIKEEVYDPAQLTGCPQGLGEVT
jgi:hypothetical protein